MTYALTALAGGLALALCAMCWHFTARYHELAVHLLAVNERLREDNQHLAQARSLAQYQQLARTSRRPEPILVADHRPPKEPRHHDDRRDPPVPVGVGNNA